MSDSTHKIVINQGYGGFSLNTDVVKRLAELGNKEAQDVILKSDKEWEEYSPEMKKRFTKDYYNAYIFEDDRTNPLLIRVVEELGEKAGKLGVVEFKGNLYRIKNYDGMEYIETPEMIRWKKVE